MNVKVHIKDLVGGSRLTFSSNPESIQTTASANYKTYQLISGSIKIPNGQEPKSISMKGVFLGTEKSPVSIKKKLDQWQRDKAKLNIKVTGLRINEDMALSSYTCTDKGAHGDVEYSMKFETYGTVMIRTTQELNLSAYTQMNEREGSDSNGGSYQVVSGDNLWKIAKKHYGGSGSDWALIYEANKETIEAEAKKHKKSSSDNGHWIYPGTVLVIPEKAT